MASSARSGREPSYDPCYGVVGFEFDAGAPQVHPEKGRSIAHVYTDYDRWANATVPYKVNYHMPYEPYYVADKGVPRYSNEFSGYGNDKTGAMSGLCSRLD